jgi:hypothetical protein
VNWEEWFQLSTPTPEATPVITREPAGDAGAETERLLETTDVPVRGLYELAVRLQGLSPNTVTTVNPGGSPDYTVGTRRLFHASNMDTDEQFDLYATLAYKTEHVYMWVEDSVGFDQEDVSAAAELFEKHTYLTNREFFGSEWTPGIDNDPHLSILNARNLGGNTLGYFSGPDEFVSAVRSDSNQMEMFYISMDNATINSDEYNSVLAHEFQHMIHWYNDRNEDTWLNEGFSELACPLNGFEPGGHEYSFAAQPDNQLNDIDYDAPNYSASYGGAYLFTAYFLDRFGPQATQTLIANPENGLTSFDAVLAELGSTMTHVDLFADWIAANILNDCSIADGRYCYREIDAPFFSADTSYSTSDYPVSTSSTVHQYATDYLELDDTHPLSLRFTGSTQIGLVDTAAHSGRYVWWSNRGDDSDMTLTRAFDLSTVSNATLEYWAWYDIEEDWDYTYVEASTDGGQTWTILTTPSGTGSNPNGNSYGWGYTGVSGSGNKGAEWIREQVDLSPYAGQQLLVRFEYITDEAVNKPGFVVDDVAIPEIGYSSDFEAGDDGWQAAGFIRHANVLPQRWLVQLILYGSQTTVQRLELNPDQTGEWPIPLGGGTNRAVITISAFAPVTTEEASYGYEIREQ